MSGLLGISSSTARTCVSPPVLVWGLTGHLLFNNRSILPVLINARRIAGTI